MLLCFHVIMEKRHTQRIWRFTSLPFIKACSYCESAPTPKRAAWEGRSSVYNCGRCFLVRHRVGSWGEWRAGLQKFGSKAEQMCFQSPPLPSSFELWTSLCVYSWPQHASVLQSSQQLTAVRSQASSVYWPPLHLGRMHDYDLLQVLIPPHLKLL